MRNIVFGILVIFFALTSCSQDDESLQRIDQVLNIYMKSTTNQDLLNAKKNGSYSSFSVNDFLGDKDVSPVNTFALKMRQDSTYYLEYIAGAKRKKFDSAGTTYYSRMRVTLTKTVDNKPESTIDTLEIHYRNSPNLFQVSKVFYNKKPVFSKEADNPAWINNVTITK